MKRFLSVALNSKANKPSAMLRNISLVSRPFLSRNEQNETIREESTK
jgi:hypothetical protein